MLFKKIVNKFNFKTKAFSFPIIKRSFCISNNDNKTQANEDVKEIAPEKKEKEYPPLTIEMALKEVEAKVK